MTAQELATELMKYKDAEVIVYDAETDRIQDVDFWLMRLALVLRIRDSISGLGTTTWLEEVKTS